MPDRLIVVGRWVWADREGGPELLEDHAVVVEGRRISAIAPTAEIGIDAGERLDVPDGLVLPGLVNAHAHVGSSPPLRGIPEDLPDVGAAGSALFQVTSPVSDLLYSAELAGELAVFAEWDLLAMIRSGVTTVVNETVASFEDYVEAALRVGVRTYVSPMFPAGNRERGYLKDGQIAYGAPSSLADDLDRSVAYHSQFDRAGDGRVRVKLSPHAPDTVDPSILAEVRRRADRLGCPITIHAAQSRNEVDQVRRRHGAGPIEHLANVGLLGPDVLITHVSYPEVDDFDRLRAAGASVVHCPTRKAREAVASPYVPFLQAGIRTTLGTDAYNTDFLADLRLAAVLGKIGNGSVTRPTARDVLDSATRNGADALGRPDLGRLREGSLADITVVSLTGAHVGPVLDPVRSLVYYARADDVHTVLVDGRPLLIGGRIATVDEDDLRRRVGVAAERLWSTARERGALGRLGIK
jgi:5-methylthioadenosine/S-adenosylhomocysteine deaminase